MIDYLKILMKAAGTLPLLFSLACSTKQALKSTMMTAARLNNQKLTVVGRKASEHLPSNPNVKFCESTETEYCYLGKLQNSSKPGSQIAEFRLPRSLETGRPSKVTIWLIQPNASSAQTEVQMFSGDISRISVITAEALLTATTNFKATPPKLKLTGVLDERTGTWTGTFEFNDTYEKGSFSASIN